MKVFCAIAVDITSAISYLSQWWKKTTLYSQFSDKETYYSRSVYINTIIQREVFPLKAEFPTRGSIDLFNTLLKHDLKLSHNLPWQNPLIGVNKYRTIR